MAMSTPHPITNHAAQGNGAIRPVPPRAAQREPWESAEMMIKYAPMAKFPIIINGVKHVTLNDYCEILEALFPAPNGSKLALERQERLAALDEQERARKVGRLRHIADVNHRGSFISIATVVSTKVVEAWESQGPAQGVRDCASRITRIMAYWFSHPGVTDFPGEAD